MTPHCWYWPWTSDWGQVYPFSPQESYALSVLLSILQSLGKSHYVKSTLKGPGITNRASKGEYIPVFLEVLPHAWFINLSHLCMYYLIINLYLTTDSSWMLITWILVQYYIIYFLAQIVPALTTGNTSVGYCVPLTCPHCCGCSGALPHFLALPAALESSWVSPAVDLESALSPRSTGSFYWRTVLETRSECWVCLWLLGCHCF